MIYILLIILFILFISFNKLKSFYNMYKLLKSTVDPENKKNCCVFFYDMTKFAYNIFNPKKVEKFNKHIKVPYEYNDNKYFYLLKVPRGIMPIDWIKDENDNDIYDVILPYLGPNLDCHGSEIYPRDFGLKKIVIKNINDKEYTFEENEKIIL